MELAPHGITVNAICPGSADTDRLDFLGRRADGSYDEALRAEAIAERSAQIPLGRVATVEDVAELTAFLASDAAGYVTGQADQPGREAPSCTSARPGGRRQDLRQGAVCGPRGSGVARGVRRWRIFPARVRDGGAARHGRAAASRHASPHHTLDPGAGAHRGEERLAHGGSIEGPRPTDARAAAVAAARPHLLPRWAGSRPAAADVARAIVAPGPAPPLPPRTLEGYPRLR